MKDLKKLSCLPLLLALTFTGVAPAGADTAEEPAPSPPRDTGGHFVSVPAQYYDPIDIDACGSTVTMTAGDVQDVEWKVNIRRDGSTVIKYRGDTTVDLTRTSDHAFIDELDVSGRYTEHISADQNNYSASLKGPSIIWPLSSAEADAIADAGLPEFFYFEKGRFAIDIAFSEDPKVLEPVSIDVTKNSTRHVSDVCELLDEAAK